MTKALLIIWIGFADTQAISIVRFDTMSECRAALAALGEYSFRTGEGRSNTCIPYVVKP